MASITDPIPNSPFYSAPTYSVSSALGPLIVGSGLAVDQYGQLLVASASGGTVTAIATGDGLTGGTITDAGTISLVPATNISLGGIKVGANLLISPDGTLSAYPPGIGTISGVFPGPGLTGGGTSGNVTLGLKVASTTEFGGVSIGPGIDVSSGVISLAAASTTDRGGVQIATSTEVIAGSDPDKVVTPATLQSKVASLTARGLVQLSNSVATNDDTKAATQTAAKAAYDAAAAAQLTADGALPKAGGTMTGVVTFAPGQTFPGVAFPVATVASLGVVQPGTGLVVSSSGILSTTNNGTVTSIVPGPGLGAPATGNPITTSGTLRLLPPTTDGLTIGGVKAGNNVEIATDGTISVAGALLTNNQYAFNSYQWPVPKVAPALPCPGENGQVLTIVDNVTATLGWTNTGTLTSVVAGTGLTVTSTATTATVSLSSVPSLTPGSVGATGLIPTLAINAQGQVTSYGLANPYSPFQNATTTIPTELTLNFADNNTNWEWSLTDNVMIQTPTNSQSGQRGSLVLIQNPVPKVVTWSTGWKNVGAYAGPAASEMDLVDFVVVSPNRIVITSIASNIA